MPRCYVRCRWGTRNLVSRSCHDFSVGLDRQRRLRFVARVVLLTLSAYSHFQHTYTLFVDSLFSRLAWARCSHGIHHARRGLFAALLTCLAWACGSRGIRYARRGLFAALLTCLAWARCSRSIRHTRRGLFAAVLTRLAWAHCSSWEWWSQRRSRGCRGRSVGRDN